MSDRLVTVATFPNSIDAHLAIDRLRAAGLKACLADEATVSMAWHLSTAIGWIKLQVCEQDAEAALQILHNQLDPNAPAADEDEAGSAESLEDVDRAPDDDQGDDDEPVAATSRDDDADRALRAAVFGLMLFPLQFYVYWLLLGIAFSKEPLSENKRWKVAVAAGILFGFVMLVITALIY